MPGFIANGFGTGIDSTADYYYTYTWSIPRVIGRDGTRYALVHLKDTTTPTFTANKESYVASSLEYKYAKSVTWDDVKVSWYDTYGLIKIVKEWRESVWTAVNGLRPANNYKKDTAIECFLPSNESPYGWRLYGSWPSQIRYGDLTYTNSEVKNVEVSISYDWAEECVGGPFRDSGILECI